MGEKCFEQKIYIMHKIFNESFKILFIVFLFAANLFATPQNSVDSTLKSFYYLDKEDVIDSAAATLSFYRNSNPFFALELGLKVISDSNFQKSKNLGKLFDEIGVCYRKAGLFEKALEFHFKALNKFEEEKYLMGKSFAYTNIGTIYRLLGNYDFALKYYDQAIKIKEELKDKYQVSYTLHYIGITYAAMNDLQTAKNFLNQTKKMKLELKDFSGLANTNSALGDVLFKENKFDDSEKIYEDAFKRFIVDKNDFGACAVANSMANLFIKTKKEKEAEKYLEIAESLATKLNSNSLLVSVNKSEIELEKSRGNFEAATKYYDEFIKFKEKLYQLENEKIIKSAEANYYYDKVIRENEILKKSDTINKLEMKQKEYVQYFLTIVFAVAFVFAFSFWKKNRIIRKYNKALSKNKSQLLNLNKKLQNLNETKDRFFSIVAHDLKNPFHYLINSSQLLKEEFDSLSGEEKKMLISDIEKVSRESHDLLIDLLNWASLQDGNLKVKKENFFLDEIVEKNIQLLENLAQNKSIKLIFSSSKNAFVNSDKEMLSTIYRNLLNNAIKFSNNGTEIKTEISIQNENALLAISDSGIGMDDEVKENLFKAEARISRNGTMHEKGSGLGLSLCKELIKENGGEITFESELGKGTTFYVTIPLAEKVEIIQNG